MTENEASANDSALVLVPMRNRQRLQKKDSLYPSHSFIPIQHVGLIGRPQLLSCLYAACDCDGSKKIGSSKNKCPECQEVTTALGKYMSRETLEIVKDGVIRCRGGKNASVSVNSVPVSSNESWSEEIHLQSGMIVSFATNFEYESSEENIQLSFEVVSCSKISRNDENSPQKERQNAATNKRPLEQSEIAPEPNKATKLSHATNGAKRPIGYHMPPLRLHTSDSSPTLNGLACTPRSSNFEENTKGVNPCLSVSKSPVPNTEKDLATIAPLEKSNSWALEHRDTTTDSKEETSTLSSRGIQGSDESMPRKGEYPLENIPAGTLRTTSTTVTTGLQPAIPIVRPFNSSSDKFQPLLFFCPLGQDMSKGLIKTLSDSAQKLGAIVVDRLDLASHLIVSSSVSSWEKVAKRLKMDEDGLLSLLSSKDVKVITPRWIRAMTSEGTLRKPISSETWRLVSTGGAEKIRSKEFPSRHTERKEKEVFKSNNEISKIFRELGELYQDCPLEANDLWRAYQFRINAGRVKLLPFELSFDTLGKLRKEVTGFGDSCIEIIRQYLENGEVERIQRLKTDKRRTAMRNVMDIWGVGKHAALRLINDGCSSIDDVRRRLANKTLFLERNQLVGAECYEDIRERMSRPEVQQIGEIIQGHVLKLFPGAEVKVMGSYRRGRTTCGDVDVHITSNDYRTRIPRDALGSIVDSLWRDGHIAFHLTFLYGMETGNELGDYQQAGKNLEPTVWETSKPLRLPTTANGEKSHSTYMGVFNSPLVKGTRRRVDLKFYAYRERVFASLYFTGNGFFNRSMRLWARQRGWQLNDSGLFNRGTTERILEATEERQVFDMLGLVYKHPHERDSFDALEPKTGEAVDYEPTKGEFREFQESAWIE